MVKFRGIEVSLISQFDIRKLPEFHLRQSSPPPDADPFTDVDAAKTPLPTAIASCYVPIYPGSQIWFEYSIDGPHPPKAAYSFKLFFNDTVITTWDCTEKHDYYGKMMYNLVCEGKDERYRDADVVRQALRFSSEVEDDAEPSKKKDVIEVRVYRIEHRQRIRSVDAGLGRATAGNKPTDNLQ